mgnify:CR=1 FL=1
MIEVTVKDNETDKIYPVKVIGNDQREAREHISLSDVVASMSYYLNLYDGLGFTDDIDHLGNRRLRSVGELLENQFRVGLLRMERSIKERMSSSEIATMMPRDLINSRPLSAALREFFASSQLSQFMDQTNPLSEITHKRRLSALGPGGLTRERAGFEVRDVHPTHYGRVCPIETPEGPNIGLISSLCIHARINDFGFIETPYRVVKDGKVTDKIEYLQADKEEGALIATATVEIDAKGKIVQERVRSRRSGDFVMAQPTEIEYMDVAPNQIVSAAAAMIPFLEHDDANRALMGSNMQRQAVPLLRPEEPIVGTGMEAKIARDSRAIVTAERDGVVRYVDATKVIVDYDSSKTVKERLVSFEDDAHREYHLTKFFRTNQDTCINQRPVVRAGQRFLKGDVLVDSSSTRQGELALGRNLMVAFMPWRGYNFEDAIVISERVVNEDVYTSVHIDVHSIHVRDTKRGEEELTREIPNVSDEAVRNLDENGIIRVGSEVTEGDILVGKITPKGETDPTPEEKLLRAIFGDKAGDVKDASLKLPPGSKGVVINSQLFSRRIITKDTDVRKEEKRRQEMLENQLEQEVTTYTRQLAEKLDTLLDGKVSVGIRDLDGSTVIRSGTALKEDTFLERLADGADIGSWSAKDDWVDNAKLNVNGSSLAAGHPFAATGGRILPVLAKLLAQKGSGKGVISVCAAGGQGVTAILERP